jgi:hypothetical protein
VTFAQPALGQRLDAHGSYSRIVPGQTLQNLAGAIGGTIVNDYDFHLDARLSEKQAHGLFNSRFFVVCREDD